jgi:hypothetical protein
MSLQPDNFYARRRVLSSPAAVFHEHGTPSDRPTERIVQSIWQHQRLRRDQLQTATGRPIRVLHPGFVSVEGGPDFRSAVLQIGDDPPCSGDVEVDLRPGGWRGHGHDRNPAFQNVILQVLWDESPPAAGTPPGLVLKNYLDTPLEELALSLENQPLSTLPAEWRGRCCAPLHALNEEKLAGLLRDAAHVRLETKAAQLRARARQAGWEQSLWEGLFRALGYKHNVWPMQSLAETRSRWQPGADTVLTLQTRLLGVGGLLPDELTRAQKSSDTWLRRAWDGWWRERDAFLDCLLPHSIWKFHGLRPANHPQRRLVLAAQWLAKGDLPARLENWCTSAVSDPQLLASLHPLLTGAPDDFWSWHWTLRSPRLNTPKTLLGENRLTDLAVNVILPWLWVRAVEGKNERLRGIIEQRYFAWPAAEDNAVLKLARQRLLGVGRSRLFSRACAQQGLLQIVRDYCGNSNAVCENCQFPELVREWDAGVAELKL